MLKMDFKLLDLCTFDTAVQFYANMIDENRQFDDRLKNYTIDEKSIRNLLQYSYGTEDDLFYLAYIHNVPVGFIDSTKLTQENGRTLWFIKAVYLQSNYRSKYYFDLLINKVEQKVFHKGIKQLMSTALTDDKTANVFWENAGFVLEEGKRIKNL
jgi:GNAT superfamily N-acetyltransferase